MNRYDVIIVGAGPAGSQCARELSALGYKILLLERSKIIGEPNFSSGGTVKETLTTFNLPRKVAQAEWNSLSIVSKNERIDLNYGKPMGYVLDYKTLKQFLVEDAKKNGTKVMTGTTAKTPIIEDGLVKGIKFTGGEAYAEIIIDATGNAGFLSSKFGIIKNRSSSNSAFGVEYLCSNVKMENSHSLQFYLGETYAPHGYLWVFPVSNNKAKVGYAEYGTTSNRSHKQRLDNFMKSNNQTKNSKIEDFHGGQVIFEYPNSFVKSNLIAIGDSGGQCNPLGGEGIRHALSSGRIASQVTAKYLSSKTKRLSILKEYDSHWRKYTGRRWKLSYELTLFVYERLTDSNADKMVRICKRLPPNSIVDILFYYKFPRVLRLLFWPRLRQHRNQKLITT